MDLWKELFLGRWGWGQDIKKILTQAAENLQLKGNKLIYNIMFLVINLKKI